MALAKDQLQRRAFVATAVSDSSSDESNGNGEQGGVAVRVRKPVRFRASRLVRPLLVRSSNERSKALFWGAGCRNVGRQGQEPRFRWL